MEIGYIILIGICSLALGILVLNIKVVMKIRYLSLKIVCCILFVFTMFRYLTLIVYGGAPTYDQLMALRYFYLASSIGLTIPTLSALWYIIPLYREKISYRRYLLFFTPWVIFYSYVIITQPTKIVQGNQFGYALQLVGEYPIYLSMARGSLIALIFMLCIIGLFKYKNIQLKVQLIMIMTAQVMMLLDGLTYYIKVVHTFPVFTVSELFGFIAVLYAFSNRIIEGKGISNK